MRPWREDDAPSLFEYAKDPDVGPIAGWPVHPDIEYSRKAIAEYLSGKGIFAVVLEGTDAPIGSIGVLVGKESNFDIADDEGEIGYWIGVPHWGQGLIPEAMCELVRYCFEEIGLVKLWCGYFDGNEKSMRVQEKCGFTFHHTERDKKIELIDALKTEHVTLMTKEQWAERESTG